MKIETFVKAEDVKSIIESLEENKDFKETFLQLLENLPKVSLPVYEDDTADDLPFT